MISSLPCFLESIHQGIFLSRMGN